MADSGITSQATGSWLQSAAPVVGAGLDAAGGLFGSLFSANQAKKNRAFQERMYNRQFQDNLYMWNLMNEYNAPSQQLARLREAGLSPLLMYQNGAQGMVATSPADSAKAPSGDSARYSGSTNFGQAMAQAALLKAQIENINADTLNKRKEAQLKTNQDEWYHITKDIDLAKKYSDNDLVNQTIEYIATQDKCLENLTYKQLEDITSIIEMRQKYYDLDFRRTHNQIWYNIESIALGKAHVSNELKGIAVQWYNAQTQRKEVEGHLKVFQATVDNLVANKELTEQEKTNKILDAYNTLLKNTALENIGTEQLTGLGGLLLLLTGNITGRIKE